MRSTKAEDQLNGLLPAGGGLLWRGRKEAPILNAALDGCLVLKASGCELPEEVVKINLAGRQLASTLPQELQYFHNVTEVVADDNRLLLEHFSIFPQVQRLSLINNNITALFRGLQPTGFSRLEHLDLSLNRIQDFEPLAHMTSLKSLNLAKTGLTEIPQALVELRGLRALDLSFNSLSEETALDLWTLLSHLPALRDLSLAHNRFSTIQEPRSTLSRLAFHRLDLSGNCLETEFDVVCLTGLGALDQLDLTGNRCVLMRESIRALFQAALKATVIFQARQGRSFRERKTSFGGLHYSQIPLERVRSERESLVGQRDLLGFSVNIETAPLDVPQAADDQTGNLPGSGSRPFSIKSGFYGRGGVAVEEVRARGVYLTESRPVGASLDRHELGQLATGLPNSQLIALTRRFLDGHPLQKRLDLTSCFKYLNNYFSL